MFAYADDIAILCLGYSEVREALSITEAWAVKNDAQMNRNKCGIIRLTRKETPISIKSLDGVPFVHEYKYLGIPLDQALTLKYLLPIVTRRINVFCARIHLILHSNVGFKAKLGLWQAYARCHFDYFAPTMALCGQLAKFETLYTRSLKKALDLPLHIPNSPLLAILGIPSLEQISAHHI